MRKLVVGWILCSLGALSCSPSSVPEPVKTARTTDSVAMATPMETVMPQAAPDIDHNPATASEPRGLQRPGSRADCKGSVSDYCKLHGGTCPMYEQSLAQRGRMCSHPPSFQVQTHLCEGVYRSVSWNDSLLGGGEEFFNASGELIAASLHTDYDAYCGGTSFSQTFGEVPVCRETATRTNICK